MTHTKYICASFAPLSLFVLFFFLFLISSRSTFYFLSGTLLTSLWLNAIRESLQKNKYLHCWSRKGDFIFLLQWNRFGKKTQLCKDKIISMWWILFNGSVFANEVLFHTIEQCTVCSLFCIGHNEVAKKSVFFSLLEWCFWPIYDTGLYSFVMVYIIEAALLIAWVFILVECERSAVSVRLEMGFICIFCRLLMWRRCRHIFFSILVFALIFYSHGYHT